MNFLFDNPLANMPGPIFLVLYGAIVLFSPIVFALLQPNFDWTSKQSPPLVPPNPDPFEIAYLRGGENEFARALVFSLTHKGFLKIINDNKKSYIGLAQNQPNWTTLSTIEREALKWFQVTRETSEVFGYNGLTNILKAASLVYEQKMKQNYFLTPRDVSIKTRIFSLLSFGLIVVLGVYKSVAEIIIGANAFFLIIFTVVAFILALALGKTNRLSARGKNYVKRLQNAFDKLRYNQTQTVPTTTFGAVDPTLLAVGLFGTGILAGTIYNDYEQAFHRSSAASSSGSCGGGCGSSSCSSGDSGSSCSGGSSCGGGGCGGGGGD